MHNHKKQEKNGSISLQPKLTQGLRKIKLLTPIYLFGIQYNLFELRYNFVPTFLILVV